MYFIFIILIFIPETIILCYFFSPDFRFNDHISDEMTDDQPKKLLKRDDRLLGGSLDEVGLYKNSIK